MKKNVYVSFFIFVHIIFIFLIVHKHTLLIKDNYAYQEAENKKSALIKKLAELKQHLHELKDYTAIKKYARTHLSMKPYTLQQIKKLSNYE